MMYNKLRGKFDKVTWRRLVCNNQGCPKWLFILYLAVQKRLYTKDKLSKWGIINCQTCSLCELEEESHQHLFFKCTFSASIWQKLLLWQGINRQTQGWEAEISWAVTHAAGKQAQAEIYRLTLGATIYQIWMERNYRIFQKKKRSSKDVTRMIIQEVHCRGSMKPKLYSILTRLNFYP